MLMSMVHLAVVQGNRRKVHILTGLGSVRSWMNYLLQWLWVCTKDNDQGSAKKHFLRTGETPHGVINVLLLSYAQLLAKVVRVRGAVEHRRIGTGSQ